MSTSIDESVSGALMQRMQLVREAYRLADFLSPVADLLLRGWVAWAFFQSGLTKIQSIDTTLLLFEHEYSVPLLPPDIAAYLSIFGELVLPVLLVAGIAGRIAAAGLFIVNIVAVVSYPALMEAGLAMHQAWGIVLLVYALRGPGKLSADYLIARRLGWA